MTKKAIEKKKEGAASIRNSLCQDPISIVVFSDENSQEELVYAIAVDTYV